MTSSNFRTKAFNQPTMGYLECREAAFLDKNLNCLPSKITFNDARDCINSSMRLGVSPRNCMISEETRNKIYLMLARPLIKVYMTATANSKAFYEALKKPFKTNSTLDSSASHKPEPQASLAGANTIAKNPSTISDKTSEKALQLSSYPNPPAVTDSTEILAKEALKKPFKTNPSLDSSALHKPEPQAPLASTNTSAENTSTISDKTPEKALQLNSYSNPLALTDSTEKLPLDLEKSSSSHTFNAAPVKTIYLNLNNAVQGLSLPVISMLARLTPNRETLEKALQIAPSKFSDTGVCLARNISLPLNTSALPAGVNPSTIGTEGFEKPSENDSLSAADVAMIFAVSFITFRLLKTALTVARKQCQKLQNRSFSVLG